MGPVSIPAKNVDCQVPAVPDWFLPFSIVEFTGLMAVRPGMNGVEYVTFC